MYGHIAYHEPVECVVNVRTTLHVPLHRETQQLRSPVHSVYLKEQSEGTEVRKGTAHALLESHEKTAITQIFCIGPVQSWNGLSGN